MAKRGRPQKHWAAQAQIQAWGNEVSRRGGLEPSQLDVLFAWREGEYENRLPGERPKTFERIMRNSREPQGRDPRWRSFVELLDAVEQHPDYRGTKRIYTAGIWRRMQEQTIRPSALQRNIASLLSENDLVRVKPINAFVEQGSVWIRNDPVAVLNRCLQLSIQYIDHLSALELVWCLYVEAELVSNHDVRAMLLSLADSLLDKFFSWATPDHYLHNYRSALRSLHEAKLDFSDSEYPTSSNLEVVCRWPILPRELVGQITWERSGLLLIALLNPHL